MSSVPIKLELEKTWLSNRIRPEAENTRARKFAAAHWMPEAGCRQEIASQLMATVLDSGLTKGKMVNNKNKKDATGQLREFKCTTKSSDSARSVSPTVQDINDRQ